MVHIVMKQTLYNETRMALEQCKLTIEFKSNIELNVQDMIQQPIKYDTET